MTRYWRKKLPRSQNRCTIFAFWISEKNRLWHIQLDCLKIPIGMLHSKPLSPKIDVDIVFPEKHNWTLLRVWLNLLIVRLNGLWETPLQLRERLKLPFKEIYDWVEWLPQSVMLWILTKGHNGWGECLQKLLLCAMLRILISTVKKKAVFNWCSVHWMTRENASTSGRNILPTQFSPLAVRVHGKGFFRCKNENAKNGHFQGHPHNNCYPPAISGCTSVAPKYCYWYWFIGSVEFKFKLLQLNGKSSILNYLIEDGLYC